MQVLVENCNVININSLQKAIRNNIDRDLPDPSEEVVFDITQKEMDNFVINGQKFKYLYIKNKLGGYRWFFICPSCERRCNKLFHPPEMAIDRKKLYLCKVCHKLKNQSALTGQNFIYRKVTRPLKRMSVIEKKIARGHLRGTTVQALLDEYEKLESKLKNSPEFRLYSFKQKHNIVLPSKS